MAEQVTRNKQQWLGAFHRLQLPKEETERCWPPWLVLPAAALMVLEVLRLMPDVKSDRALLQPWRSQARSTGPTPKVKKADVSRAPYSPGGNHVDHSLQGVHQSSGSELGRACPDLSLNSKLLTSITSSKLYVMCRFLITGADCHCLQLSTCLESTTP